VVGGPTAKEAYNSGLDGLARRSAELVENRTRATGAGAAVGFPRFKSKHRSGAVGSVHHRCDPSRGPIAINVGVATGFGRVRTHESTRKLARRLEAGTARILSVTVGFTGGRWQCAFQVVVEGKLRPSTTRPPITATGRWVSMSG